MQQQTVSMDDIKEAVVKQIIDARVQQGLITSQTEYDIEYEELKNKVSQNTLIASARPQSDLTDSQAFTDTVQELYIDLCSVFGVVNELDQTINKHKKINESVLNNLKIQIAKANDSLDNMEAMLREKYNSNNFVETFRDMDGFEDAAALYTDRFGEAMSISYRANFDKFNESISLPYINKNNTLIHSNGTSFADIKVIKQLGSGISKITNERTNIKKAIDTSTDTYWSETISCDSPMSVEMDSQYYNLKSGAVCEIEIRMENMAVINEVSFIPYGQYPFEVVAIRYYETDDTTEPIKEIVFKGNTDKSLSSRVLTGPTSFRFPDVYCKKLRILVNQIHYTKETFICSTNDAAKNELWFKAVNPVEPSVNNGELFAPLYYDKAIKDPAWVMLNANAHDIKDLNVDSLLYGSVDKKKHLSKYNYTYGFYNIGVYNNDYQDIGIFVSKPIKAHGSIKGLLLETEELHPKTAFGVMTDIEYFISYGDNWIPILPVNINKINSELLIQAPGKPNGFCNLRFKATNLNSIKANGMPMVLGVDYSIVPDAAGNVEAVMITSLMPNIKYTAEYEPVTDKQYIEFIDSGITPLVSKIEKFNGTNSVFNELSEIPYLTPSSNTSMKVITSDGRILTEQEGDIVCVTNIYNTGESYKKFSTSNKLQYYVDKGIVYFNRAIPETYTVELNYSHFVSSVRLKAILRRNAHSNNWLSPVLDNFRIKFNTID